MFACPATDDFFRSRIDHMIDLRHPLAVLASRMPGSMSFRVESNTVTGASPARTDWPAGA